jgi:hypothetical protein
VEVTYQDKMFLNTGNKITAEVNLIDAALALAKHTPYLSIAYTGGL